MSLTQPTLQALSPSSKDSALDLLLTPTDARMPAPTWPLGPSARPASPLLLGTPGPGCDSGRQVVGAGSRTHQAGKRVGGPVGCGASHPVSTFLSPHPDFRPSCQRPQWGWFVGPSAQAKAGSWGTCTLLAPCHVRHHGRARGTAPRLPWGAGSRHSPEAMGAARPLVPRSLSAGRLAEGQQSPARAGVRWRAHGPSGAKDEAASGQGPGHGTSEGASHSETGRQPG